jgi:hypothetical protein
MIGVKPKKAGPFDLIPSAQGPPVSPGKIRTEMDTDPIALSRRMDYAAVNPLIAAYMDTGDKVFTDLDPIDPTTVGRASVPRMLEWSVTQHLSIFVLLLTLISSGAGWLADVPAGHNVYVDPRYLGHMQELHRVGLLSSQRDHAKKKRHRTWVRFWSRYFAVEKTSATSRSIFNGNRLSSVCPSPPNVNLLTQPDVLKLIGDMAKSGRQLYFLEADLRHWFHQIPVCDEVSRFFGLKLRTGRSTCWFTWTGLPMGWSWSPAVAQAAGWICLLYNSPGQDDMAGLFNIDRLRQDPNSLPRWVSTKSGDSVAVVYYDNLLVMSTNCNELDEIEKRLRENVSREVLNVEIKGEINRSIDHVRYLGMDINIDRPDRYNFVIQVTPTKLDKWRKVDLNENDTCRAYASFVGRVMFVASLADPNLRRTRLGRIAIGLAQHVGYTAHKHGWRYVIAIPKLLRDVWDEVLITEQQPIRIEGRIGRVSPGNGCTGILATDASMLRYGVVMMDRDGKSVLWVKGDIWSMSNTPDVLKTDEEEHIFYKELRAVLFGLTQLKPRSRVLVVVDNAAVAWVLKNGFCKTIRGNDMLMAHEEHLAKIFDVCLVVSADNVADSPSRGEELDPDRIARTVKAVKLHREGIRWASFREEGLSWARYRHVEPDDADLVGPDDVEDPSDAEEDDGISEDV